MAIDFPIPSGISELRSSLRSGRLKAEEVTTFYLERIRQLDPLFNTFIDVAEDAVSQCRAITREDGRPLAGIPVSIKDLILTRDLPTSGGSRAPFNVPRRDAAVVRALRDAGAIIIGKTNLHEFAFGITNENAHFGPVHNPWNLDRISGGSSGGSAAAVAARLSPGSIGTDTRGSIRIPAACCGVCGLKPTRGAVSTAGVLPLSRTLDHVGPLAGSAEDLKLLFDAIRRDRPSSARTQPKTLRLAVVPWFEERLDPEVGSAVAAAREVFRSEGHILAEVEMEGLREAIDASDVISRAEAVAVHDRRLQRWPDRFDPRVRERLSTGYSLSAVELARALQTRRKLLRSFRALFENSDGILAPSLPVTAPPLGTTAIPFGSVLEPIVYCFVRLMAAQNMAGIPALSIPCGFDSAGMPIGLQLIGRWGEDDRLLRLGIRFQQLTDWHRRIPPAAALHPGQAEK